MSDDTHSELLALIGAVALAVTGVWLLVSLVIGAVGVFIGPSTKAEGVEYFLECRGREKTPDLLPDVVGGVDMKFCAQAVEK